MDILSLVVGVGTTAFAAGTTFGALVLQPRMGVRRASRVTPLAHQLDRLGPGRSGELTPAAGTFDRHMSITADPARPLPPVTPVAYVMTEHGLSPVLQLPPAVSGSTAPSPSEVTR